MLSGVVLAGANQRREIGSGTLDDGILTAEEISALPLESVELVVLSACRSGAGTVATGEGVFGLRRAFLTAGVDTVVANLWDVEDEAARDWIAAFYRERLESGRTIPQAVRAATLRVLEDRRAADQSAHPFYWGGWLASGAVR